METKILKAVFGGGTSTVTNKRTRTDYGQVLEIIGIDLPDTFECIFSNSATSAGTGKKMIGSSQRVLIPDEYLTTGQTIYAWILLHDTEDDGRHMYSVRIPVADMPDTSPEEPTPVEQSVISQAITALNSAVTTTTQKAQEASDSADRAEHAAEDVEGYAERAEAAQSASESARDRATQAETSARTSAATATEKASEAISSATTASQSALNAETASESAQASADASYQNAQTAYRYAQDSATSAGQAESYASGASGYASDAQVHSQTASTKAQEASQSASAASQKASEAAQSASSASQAKTDAETAKQASETAQGLAESARDGAVSAKTVAESARDEAQSIADGITGKVEQIDSNTERIESLEDDRYKPYPHDSASGSIASFPDGAENVPLKSCIVRVEPVQAGSGDPSPDNVRPITGWTGCEVVQTNKNLLIADNPLEPNANYFNGTTGTSNNTIVYSDTEKAYTTKYTIGEQVSSGVSYSNHAKINAKHESETRLFIAPKTATYTFYVEYKNVNTPYGIRFYTISIDGTHTRKKDIAGAQYSVWKSDTVTVNLAKGEGISLIFYNHIYWRNMMIVEGDITDFVENVRRTYPITFPSEAGTVYGAYVDVINGELVVDRAQIASYNGETLPSTWISDRDVYASGTTPTIGAQVVYKLAEPIYYPLTPTEIKTLLGQNNIWADCGNVSVEYRADTRLYIEKLTQPEENDMIADSAISEGQFFMVGNSLYRALANIASGATITVGTNAQRVSLSDALNIVNA